MKAYEKLSAIVCRAHWIESIDRAKTLQGQLSSAGIAIFPANHTYVDWLAIQSAHSGGWRRPCSS